MPTHIQDLASHIELRIPKGDGRTILFELRKLNARGPQNVSTADAFEFRWKAVNGVIATVYPSASHPEADWSVGKVPVDISSTMTAVVGAVSFSLIAVYGLSLKTVCTGRFEVYDHP